MAGRPFVDIHAGAESQLGGAPLEIEDTVEIRELRKEPETIENLLSLGKALSRSLRYREAIEVYTKVLALDGDNYQALRLRAGRYLSTLQAQKATEGFIECLGMEGKELECRYRLGLAWYYLKEYSKANLEFELCLPLCNPEMEIAVIYWHTLSSLRVGTKPKLLSRKVERESVGHHYSYWDGVAFLRGEMSETALRERAAEEACDMEYSMKMYALHVLNESKGVEDTILEEILERGEYWFCFSSLAAWNDLRR